MRGDTQVMCILRANAYLCSYLHDFFDGARWTHTPHVYTSSNDDRIPLRYYILCVST